MARLTPFQTVGPYLHLGLCAGLAPMTAPGRTTPIVIGGRLLDGASSGIGDGVLEFWASGFDGLGRVWTGADGSYELHATRPATRVEPGGAVHAPHFAVRVLARGILTEYLTRLYFAMSGAITVACGHSSSAWNMGIAERAPNFLAM